MREFRGWEGERVCIVVWEAHLPPATCHLSSVCSDIPAIIWPSNIMQAEKASHESCHVWLVLFVHFSSVLQSTVYVLYSFKVKRIDPPLVSSRFVRNCAIWRLWGWGGVQCTDVQWAHHLHCTAASITTQYRQVRRSGNNNSDKIRSLNTRYLSSSLNISRQTLW